jgi:hypothetical protein
VSLWVLDDSGALAMEARVTLFMPENI